MTSVTLLSSLDKIILNIYWKISTRDRVNFLVFLIFNIGNCWKKNNNNSNNKKNKNSFILFSTNDTCQLLKENQKIEIWPT